MDCGDGNVLTGFTFGMWGCSGNDMRYKYQCATPVAKMAGTQVKYTGCNTAQGHKLQYLDRHAPNCGSGNPMQGFYFTSSGCSGGNFRYKFKCNSKRL